MSGQSGYDTEKNVFKLIDKLRHISPHSLTIDIVTIFIGLCHVYYCLSDTITNKSLNIHQFNLTNSEVLHLHSPQNELFGRWLFFFPFLF